MLNLKVSRDSGLRRSKMAKINKGKGAGYIGGWTMFWSSNCPIRDRRNRPSRRLTFRLGRFYLGLTRNANIIPYCTH